MWSKKLKAHILATIAVAAALWVVPVSIQPSAKSGLTISVDKAQAYYGHYRRVYRRTYRRAYRRGYYYHGHYRYY